MVVLTEQFAKVARYHRIFYEPSAIQLLVLVHHSNSYAILQYTTSELRVLWQLAIAWYVVKSLPEKPLPGLT